MSIAKSLITSAALSSLIVSWTSGRDTDVLQERSFTEWIGVASGCVTSTRPLLRGKRSRSASTVLFLSLIQTSLGCNRFTISYSLHRCFRTFLSNSSNAGLRAFSSSCRREASWHFQFTMQLWPRWIIRSTPMALRMEAGARARPWTPASMG